MIKEDDPGNPPPHLPDPRDVLRDPRALLAGLPPLQTLEAFNRQTRDFLTSPHQLLANLRSSAAAAGVPALGLPQVPPPPSLTHPPSQPATPNSQRSSPVHTNGSSGGGSGGGGGGGGGSNGGQNNWSFEEQFKQVSDTYRFSPCKVGLYCRISMLGRSTLFLSI